MKMDTPIMSGAMLNKNTDILYRLYPGEESAYSGAVNQTICHGSVKELKKIVGGRSLGILKQDGKPKMYDENLETYAKVINDFSSVTEYDGMWALCIYLGIINEGYCKFMCYLYSNKEDYEMDVMRYSVSDVRILPISEYSDEQ